MKTNTTIIKALAFAMLFATACNKNEIANDENTEKKGFALPVTVNVTREGDDATKATYNETSKKLEFSAGDKLFVYGSQNNAGKFAGTLDYDAVSGKFSGTVTTQYEYTGTIDNLMETVNAFLLPAGYESYGFYSVSGSGYEATVTEDETKAFALTKAAAVEQFSFEQTISYSSGFALSPENAILNFTISGLTANKEVAVSFNASGTVISGKVTTNATGVATFAVGVCLDCKLENCTLTVDGNNIAMPTKTTEAGHIYNITRNAIPGALIGQFSVSSTKKVYFSKGNLQYQASSNTWRFAEHQYDFVGDATNGNVSVGSDKCNNALIESSYTGWIDLFGWGTSGKTFASGYGSAYQPWSKSTSSSSAYGPTGTNNLTGTYANGDWGVNMGSGWRTLTGNNSGEWNYLFNTRTVNGGQGSGHSYTKGQKVNNVLGVVLYPDDYTGAAYTTGANWSTFESAGCVFLPAAGWRGGSSVNSVGSYGAYWSSTAYDTNNARHLSFSSNSGVNTVNPTSYNGRSSGYSVRLVHDAN